MNQTPLVSVVIPCYNHAQFVQETIQSVIDQDYENIELIIIDDGSKDNSVEVIEKMKPACEARFKRFEFRHRSNKGLSITLNEALEWCEGSYYFPLASDDIIYASIISKEVSLLEKRKECGMCHAHAESIYSKPNVEDDSTYLHEFTFEQLINKNMIYAPTVMIRMSILKMLGGFDESLYMEDWDMWLRILDAGYKIAFVNEILAFYRQHENNSYKNFSRMENASDSILNKWRHTSFYDDAKLNEMIHRFCTYSELDKLRAFSYLKYSLHGLKRRDVRMAFLKLLLPQRAIEVIRWFKRDKK